MDIYELIMKVKDCDFKTAFNYLKTIVNGYNRPIVGFGGRQFKSVDLDEIVIPKIEPIKKQMNILFLHPYVMEARAQSCIIILQRDSIVTLIVVRWIFTSS